MLIEWVGILLAVFFAAILGNYVGRIVTKPIYNTLSIYIVGISVGLLIGIPVGIYFKRGWSKLFQRFQE
jgi:ABC-type dipeptide/oligopeptide/nickel transport system permease component